MAHAFDIDLFHGELSPQSAYVYACVRGLPGGQEWTLSGQVRGPFCQLAKTLPTTHSLIDQGAGEPLLARAVLPDPCYWSPDLPALYRVTLEVKRHESIVHTEQRELGIRFLGARRNSFYWENKRWVLRGVSADGIDGMPLSAWREASAAMLVNNPPDELCREASREGVLLVAYVPDATLPEFSRLARWAAVGMIVISSSADVEVLAESRRRFPNLMQAQFVGTERPINLSPHSHAAFVDERLLRSDTLALIGRGIPIVAVRRLSDSMSFHDRRAACDDLQRDLAPIGDFAGYVITSERFWQ